RAPQHEPPQVAARKLPEPHRPLAEPIEQEPIDQREVIDERRRCPSLLLAQTGGVLLFEQPHRPALHRRDRRRKCTGCSQMTPQLHERRLCAVRAISASPESKELAETPFVEFANTEPATG